MANDNMTGYLKYPQAVVTESNDYFADQKSQQIAGDSLSTGDPLDVLLFLEDDANDEFTSLESFFSE